jgi:hypothetical protein
LSDRLSYTINQNVKIFLNYSSPGKYRSAVPLPQNKDCSTIPPYQLEFIMRSHKLKPKTTAPIPVSTTQANQDQLTSKLAKMQARASRGKVDDLNAVSQVLKAQYRQQASKLQANANEEEDKQGKLASNLQVRQTQGKGNWQKRVNPSAIFNGTGSSLPKGLMAKYERLMPKVKLGHVQLYQGAEVDQALANAGLQGLTDGTRVAVSSKAQPGTLEHELGHVAQRTDQNFNLNEGTRNSYEQHADQVAAKLLANQPVSEFQRPSVQGREQRIQPSVQAKCALCAGEEKESLVSKTSSQQYKYMSKLMVQAKDDQHIQQSREAVVSKLMAKISLTQLQANVATSQLQANVGPAQPQTPQGRWLADPNRSSPQIADAYQVYMAAVRKMKDSCGTNFFMNFLKGIKSIISTVIPLGITCRQAREDIYVPTYRLRNLVQEKLNSMPTRPVPGSPTRQFVSDIIKVLNGQLAMIEAYRRMPIF